MSYQPQPGKIAYRAIHWLKRQPQGTEVLISVWADAIDVAVESLLPCLRPALEAGVVRKRTKDGQQRPAWFSLGDGTPLHAAGPDDGPDLLPHRNVAPDVKPRPGEMLPGVRGDEPVPELDPTPGTVDALAEAMNQRRWLGGRPMTLAECAAAEERPRVTAQGVGVASTELHDEEPIEDFDWCLFRNGALQVWGVQVNDDRSVTFSAQQLQELRGRVAWLPPAPRSEVAP
jgi:hypothetical protein